MRNKLLLSIGIPLLILLGGFLWLHFWANHWEQRWLTFRADAEAQGESFAWNRHIGAQVDDVDNVMMHPWVQTRGVASPYRDWQEKSLVNELLSSATWESDEFDEETGKLVRDVALEKAKNLIEEYEKDLQQLSEALARKGCHRELQTWKELIEEDTWLKLAEWINLLNVRASYYQASDQRELLAQDLQTLKNAALHAESQQSTISMVIGAGIESTLQAMAERDFKYRKLSEAEKQSWIALLKSSTETLEKKMLAVMRRERNGFLQMMQTDLRQGGLIYGKNFYESFWQRNWYVQKAFFSSNQLMVCEDFQETLANPDLMGRKLVATNFSEFAKRMDEHRKKDAIHGRFGLMPWAYLENLYASMEQMEIKRKKLIKKLSQS